MLKAPQFGHRRSPKQAEPKKHKKEQGKFRKQSTFRKRDTSRTDSKSPASERKLQALVQHFAH